MGKVRIKSFDEKEQESKDQKLKEKREQKKIAQNVSEGIENVQEETTADAPKEKKAKKKGNIKAKVRSKSYSEKAMLVDKKNKYTIYEALDLVEKLKRAKFDETVELHVNTTRTGQFGTLTLPHGTGKKTRVAIASDELIAEIEKGKVDFDVLLATSDMMPKLARVAKVLGPRGLMPNPKNGTIAKDPKESAKQFEAGQLTIKSEGKFPIVHLSVGKASFGKEKLSENITAVIDVIKSNNIKDATLKSTMSPGVRINTL